MIVPSEEALQELWLSHRVDRHQREHRPNPDYSLFITEFKEAIDKIKADAWDEGYAASDHEAYYFSTHGDTANPYRKQEEA